MYKFKNAEDMLPSEMAAYIKELHSEIEKLNNHAKDLQKPDAYVADKSVDDYVSEQELIDNMDIGEVVEVDAFKRLGHSFKVKISKNRIDDYPSRIEAEAAGMLHSV